MLKKMIRYLFLGISWGCTFFVLTGIVGTAVAGEAFLVPITGDFIRHAVGAIFVGIFCGSSAIVYTFQKVSLWKQIALHFLVGLSGYFFIAYKLGWMPVGNVLQIAGFLVVGITSFLAIWAGFYLYNKREAEKVNRRLRELEQEKEVTKPTAPEPPEQSL